MRNISEGAKQTVRTGTVTTIDPKKAAIRVKFDDLRDVDDNPIISNWIQICFQRTYGDQEYWMPDIGEDVVIDHDGRGIETAYRTGSVYSDENPPPVTDRNKHVIRYKDGTTREYDRKQHALTVRISGEDLPDDEETESDAQTRKSDAGAEDNDKGGTVDVYVEETIIAHANGDITITTDANVLAQAEGTVTVIAKGAVTVQTESTATVEAKEDITAKTEASATVEAKENIKLKAKTIDIEAEDDISIKSGGGNVSINGQKLLLNC